MELPPLLRDPVSEPHRPEPRARSGAAAAAPGPRGGERASGQTEKGMSTKLIHKSQRFMSEKEIEESYNFFRIKGERLLKPHTRKTFPPQVSEGAASVYPGLPALLAPFLSPLAEVPGRHSLPDPPTAYSPSNLLRNPSSYRPAAVSGARLSGL